MPTKDISADDLVGFAEKQLGKRYVFGTAGPNTYDCSGLVLDAIRELGGPRLSHSAADQARLGTRVGTGAIKKGDLVFFDLGRGRNSHVGIATGPTAMIEAPNSRNPVRRTTLNAYYRRRITAVRRLPYVKQASEMTQGPSSAGLTPNGVPNGSSAARPGRPGSTTRTTPGGGSDLDAIGQATRAGAGAVGSTGANADAGLGADVYNGVNDTATDAFAGISNAITSALAPLAVIGEAWDNVMAFFAPTMITRVICVVVGIILCCSGAYLMIKEVKD